MTTRKDFLIEDIMLEITNLDIASYIEYEVRDFLKYVNHYKLANIYENMEDFKAYLILLDKQNSTQILQLNNATISSPCDDDSINTDINYYLSKSGMNNLTNSVVYLSKNDYNLNNIIQGIKGYLILTVDEFCNASQTRMSINRMLFKKEHCLC